MKVGRWFTQLDLPPPNGINLADFILDIACGDMQTSKESGEDVRKRCIAQTEEYLRQSPEGYGVDPLWSLATSPLAGVSAVELANGNKKGRT